MILQARVKDILDVEERNGFKSRKVRIVVDGEYPQTLELEFVGDKGIVKPDYLKVDAIYDFSIDIRGREWINKEGKSLVFMSLNCWRFDEVIANPQVSPQEPTVAQTTKPTGDEDFPF